MSELEASYFDYFRTICARDLALYLESSSWETLVLQSAHMDLCVYHACLATSVLSRMHYLPASKWPQTATRINSASEFALLQYGIAIRYLNGHLQAVVPDTQTIKLMVLAAILFMNIEFLQRQETSSSCYGDFLLTHLRGAACMLDYHQSHRGQGQIEDAEMERLEGALQRTRRQVQQFGEYRMENNCQETELHGQQRCA